MRWHATGSGHLLSTVLYPPNGGKVWLDQVFETTAQTYKLRLSKVKDHMVKIVVTDGTRSTTQVVRFAGQP